VSLVACLGEKEQRGRLSTLTSPLPSQSRRAFEDREKDARLKVKDLQQLQTKIDRTGIQVMDQIIKEVSETLLSLVASRPRRVSDFGFSIPRPFLRTGYRQGRRHCEDRKRQEEGQEESRGHRQPGEDDSEAGKRLGAEG